MIKLFGVFCVQSRLKHFSIEIYIEMDNENEKKEYTCQYVFEKGQFAGEICGENTKSNPHFFGNTRAKT